MNKMRTKFLWGMMSLLWMWSCESVDKPTPITAIVVAPESLALEIGGTLQMEALPMPSNADPAEQPFRWESADTAVAAVSSDGLVRALSAGATEITVRSQRRTAVFRTIPVTVTANPETLTAIRVTPESLVLEVGGTRQVEATPEPANADPAEQPFRWTSANTTIAAVSSSGLVRAMAEGVTEITVRARKNTAVFRTIPVTVTAIPCYPCTDINAAATAHEELRLTDDRKNQCMVTNHGDHDAITYLGGGNDPYAYSVQLTQNVGSTPAYIKFEYKSDKAVNGCEIFVFYGNSGSFWRTGTNVRYARTGVWTCMAVPIPANISQQLRSGSTLRFDLNPDVSQALRIKNPGILYDPSAVPPAPAIDMEKAVEWFYDRMNRGARYNMNARYEVGDFIDTNGNGRVEGDCSSAVVFALRDAGASNGGNLNTDSMHDWLLTNGFQVISEGKGKTFYPQRGDIFIWGQKGQSGGAAGHTGLFIDSSNIIHMTYSCDGICVSNYNSVRSANTYEYLYRQ
jgi:hypothetical protein